MSDRPSFDISPAEIRRLIHELKNQLYVINMGMEVLKGARTDEGEFLRMIASIRTDGIEPLKSSVATLVELISHSQGNPALENPSEGLTEFSMDTDARI